MGLFSNRFGRLFNSVKKSFSKLVNKYSYDFMDDLRNNEIARSANPQKSALRWFEKNYKNNRAKYIKRRAMKVGSLVIFDYNDPLTKDELEYWDKNPLVLVVEPYIKKDDVIRVQGINLHLLPPDIRGIVLYQAWYLYKEAYTAMMFTDKDSVQVNLEWSKIKDRLAKYGAGFAFRRYAISKQENIMEFNYEDWTKAVYLPSREYHKTNVEKLQSMWKAYVANGNKHPSKKKDKN